MSQYSYVFNAHPQFIESMYLKFKEDSASVEEGWRVFFEGFEFAATANGELKSENPLIKEFGVYSIIYGFRARGHLLSTTNPIRQRRDRKPRLNLKDYGLEDGDLSKRFVASKALGLDNATLQEIVDRLNFIYCGNIGFEYTHIKDREIRHWLRDQIENRTSGEDYGLGIETKKFILEKLNGAEVFERFLHTKYIGQKRFSLEGGESAIPALQSIIDEGSRRGVEEFVIGMAHRGRLNVLANIMGKTYEQIFNEFEGTAVPDLSFGDGDVKYHLGYSSQVEMEEGKKVHLKLVPNPSHLESVNPVVIGFSRAKADILYDSDFQKICPVLIHGDAAIAGQGVVYETAQMSQLSGYYTGGTIHFVINNQIGFTTDFDDARTSIYSTGVGNMIQSPIFHVNGDDPEALIYCVKMAVEYRQKFKTDVFIDMVCYRKHGHNEGDDPKFTQPEMYGIVKNHPNPRKVYSETLIKRGDVERKLASDMEEDFWSTLQDRLDLVKEKPLDYEYQEPEQAWRSLNKRPTSKDFEESPKTGIVKDRVIELLRKLINIPEEFSPLGKVNRLIKGVERLKKDNTLDWGMAELLAYASILTDGRDIRMSGQDVKRGTFSHRHSIFYDKNTYEEYNRLDNLSEDQGKFRIYNSLLSEFAVLGFEYGYGLASPETLVIWEAQFGDFYNGAQVIVDQYISAAESKWRRMNGLVMLLPHGFEGQGPEHSSARLER
nr:2-oxoglutarate dehydrogenase E1 component [Saprospiraceae bacterium]